MEGGLGFKNVFNWNKACQIQHIEEKVTKAGSFWIAWTEAYVLKGKSFWTISGTQENSWNWRKLLQLRNLASRFIEMKNGVEAWKFLGCKYSIKAVWKEIRPKQEKV